MGLEKNTHTAEASRLRLLTVWMLSGVALLIKSQDASAAFVLSSDRYSAGANDVVVFHALNDGQGTQASTTKIQSLDITLSSAGRSLLFNFQDVDGDGATDANAKGVGMNFPLSITSTMPTGSFIRIGSASAFFIPITGTTPQAFSVVSDTTGAYRLPAVPAGSYRLSVASRPGYTLSGPSGGSYVLKLSSGQTVSGEDFGERTALPPPAFTFSSTRIADPLHAGMDLVSFYARDNGTGAWAGTHNLLAVDATLSSPGGLEIRTYDSEGSGKADDADFAGENAAPTGSFIRVGGPAFFAASSSPVANGDKYHDLQLVPAFEVAGTLPGAGVPADSGAGARIAVAVVPHGSPVTLAGKLAAEKGPVFGFTEQR